MYQISFRMFYKNLAKYHRRLYQVSCPKFKRKLSRNQLKSSAGNLKNCNQNNVDKKKKNRLRLQSSAQGQKKTAQKQKSKSVFTQPILIKQKKNSGITCLIKLLKINKQRPTIIMRICKKLCKNHKYCYSLLLRFLIKISLLYHKS